MDDTLAQLRELSNQDLRIIYFSCIKIFKEREIYSQVKSKIKDYVNKTKPVNNIIPESVIIKTYPLNGKTGQSCLVDFLSDNWKYLFNGEKYDEQRKYYVYYHTHPNKSNVFYKKGEIKIEFIGVPFYIGKGTGDRYKNFNRNRVHSQKLSYLTNECKFSKDEICHIFADNLTEIEALELESKLITFFGCKNELRGKAHFTGRNPMLLNTDFGLRPEWINDYINTNNQLHSK